MRLALYTICMCVYDPVCAVNAVYMSRVCLGCIGAVMRAEGVLTYQVGGERDFQSAPGNTEFSVFSLEVLSKRDWHFLGTVSGQANDTN